MGGKNSKAGPGAAKKGQTNRNIPVFMDAANDGQFDEIEEIYNAWTDSKDTLLAYCDDKKNTALHLAANNGHDEIVEFLVEKIIEDCSDMTHELLNKQNAIGFTPLMSACFRGYHTKGDRDFAQEPRLNIVRSLM